MTHDMITVRDCARGLAEAAPLAHTDYEAFLSAATPLCRRLLERPDLLSLGFATRTHEIPTRVVYCDGELTLLVGHEPPRIQVPTHDHGMWELLGLYRGRVDHALYERLDDGGTPGYAKLEEVDRRVMEPGDVVCVPPPPHDIHDFTAQTDHTWLLAAIPGWYADTRRYFDPQRNSYYLQSRTPV